MNHIFKWTWIYCNFKQAWITFSNKHEYIAIWIELEQSIKSIWDGGC